jgi:putative spermidine/putrescine transport system permease protein
MEAAELKVRLRPLSGWSRRSPRALWAVAPLLGLTVVVLDVPLIFLLKEAFFSPAPTLSNFRNILSSDAYTTVLATTFRVAAISCAVTLILGYPLAMWLARTTPRMRVIGFACVLVPFLVSILVRTYAWIILLGTEGAVNDTLVELGIVGSPVQFLYRDLGVLIGTIHIMLPFMVLPLYASIRRIDPRLVDAAASLGARPAHVFRRIQLPLTLPGVLTGCLTVFTLTLGFFITPAILGGGRVTMIAPLLDNVINTVGDWALAAAFSVLLFVVAAAALVLLRRFGGDRTRVASAAVATDDDRRLSKRPGHRVLALVAAGVCAFLATPVVLVIPMSFSSSSTLGFPPPGFSLRWYEAFFSDPAWLGAVRASALLALASSLLALVFGSVAAYGLARGTFRAKGLLMGQFVVPLVVPEIVSAVALYIALARLGVLGTWVGLLLAHLVLFSPLVVLVVEPAIRSVDHKLEQAAWSLGAPPWYAVLHAVLPLVRPSLFAAWIFAFIASFDALVITLFVGGTHVTLPVRMFQDLRETIDPTITAVSTMLIGLSLLAMTAIWLARRRQLKAMQAAAPGIGV